MLKKFKWKLLISSVLILLPLLGLLFWDPLSQPAGTHFGSAIDPYFASSRSILLILPIVLLVLHWLCLLITFKDPKGANQHPKALSIVFWIMPVLSWLVSVLVYAVALDVKFNFSCLLAVFFGVLFLVIGNYLPKCRQNHTMGIKLVWTLTSEENWNATHRFGGKVWVVCGVVLLAGAFLPMEVFFIAMLPIILVAGLLPTLYSYRFYQKQKAAGSVPEKPSYPGGKWSKGFRKGGIAAVAVILVLLSIVLFVGEIQITYGEDSFTVNATFWEETVIPYDSIQQISFREDFNPGMKTMGFNSPTMNLGVFENREFGRYTIFAYTSCRQAVVLNDGENILVINGKDEAATRAIYDTLISK